MILIYRFSETTGKFLAATSCSYLQQPSLSLAPHLPKSQVPSPKSQVPISPKSQVPSPGGREAVVAVVPLVPAGAAPAARSPLFYATPQGHQAVRCAPQCC